MTFSDLCYAMHGWSKREQDIQKREWERTRWLGWVLTSIQLERKDRLPMTQMYPLPWDESTPSPHNRELTIEERQKRVKEILGK